ncbi:hypothetical protein L1987_54421 [Smallanthus sonchifolius]|uniref:Uncharacterized protein n=1 Tax=Smallanthus sonchifolius TaxID=185202 RepID=A0ACB9E6Q4_9ASTR|nr:hypothetical protein L1987_54421 [Smallanthus sonchifolius]
MTVPVTSRSKCYGSNNFNVFTTLQSTLENWMRRWWKRTPPTMTLREITFGKIQKRLLKGKMSGVYRKQEAEIQILSLMNSTRRSVLLELEHHCSRTHLTFLLRAPIF